MYDIIFNGCSANVPLTIMSETRDTFEYDSFGQILFMNEDFKQSKFRLSCIVDACIPPDMGKNKGFPTVAGNRIYFRGLVM